MFILAIETTGPVGSVAVIKADKEGGAGSQAEVPMKVTTTAMSHLKNLMAMADELLHENGIKKTDLAAVAVSAGPGSFTGIRIGVSTGRAIAQALGIPCVKVDTLDLFKSEGKDVLAIFNARRGQVYASLYGKDGEALIEPGPYMLREVIARIEELRLKPVVYGDGIDAYAGDPEFPELDGYDLMPEEERYQNAVMAAKAALSKYDRGETMEYGELFPEYMRESEAEQRLKDGSLEEMRKRKLEKLMRAN